MTPVVARIAVMLWALSVAVSAQHQPIALTAARSGIFAEQVPMTRLRVSSTTARPGERITVAVRIDDAERSTVGALQGELRFDPARLSYVGQIANRDRYTVLNEVEPGRMLAAVLALRGEATRLRNEVLFVAFVVVDTGYTRGLRFSTVEMLDLRRQVRLATTDDPAEPRAMSGLPDPTRARRMTD